MKIYKRRLAEVDLSRNDVLEENGIEMKVFRDEDTNKKLRSFTRGSTRLVMVANSVPTLEVMEECFGKLIYSKHW